MRMIRMIVRIEMVRMCKRSGVGRGRINIKIVRMGMEGWPG